MSYNIINYLIKLEEMKKIGDTDEIMGELDWLWYNMDQDEIDIVNIIASVEFKR